MLSLDIILAVLYVILVGVLYEGLKAFRDYVSSVERRQGRSREWYVLVRNVHLDVVCVLVVQ